MFIKRIQIENIRAIADLELDFDGEDRRTRKWTLLLGENGTGKSTLLRCIALLLCGRDALPEPLGWEPSIWIRSKGENARIKGVLGNAKGDWREITLELRRGDTISKTLDRNVEGLAPLERAFEWNKNSRSWLPRIPRWRPNNPVPAKSTSSHARHPRRHRPSGATRPLLTGSDCINSSSRSSMSIPSIRNTYLATLKNEYRELTARKCRSADDERRLEDLREQLADAPEWNGGAEAKAQTTALRSIQALLEKDSVDLSKPPAGWTRKAGQRDQADKNDTSTIRLFGQKADREELGPCQAAGCQTETRSKNLAFGKDALEGGDPRQVCLLGVGHQHRSLRRRGAFPSQ